MHHISNDLYLADLFIKSLDSLRFESLRKTIGVYISPWDCMWCFVRGCVYLKNLVGIFIFFSMLLVYSMFIFIFYVCCVACYLNVITLIFSSDCMIIRIIPWLYAFSPSYKGVLFYFFCKKRKSLFAQLVICCFAMYCMSM